MPRVRRNPYAAYRKLLSPQRVRELSVLRPWISVRDTLWCWAWIVAAWLLVFFVPAWWTVLLAIPVIGSRYYGLFIIGHDGMHRRIFNSGPASDLFTDLFLIGPIGLVNRVNAKAHLDHHQHLANDEDPDLHKHACFNKTNRLEYMLFLTGLSSVISVFRNLFVKTAVVEKTPASSEKKLRHTLRDLVILAAWQLALICGLTLAMGYAFVPLFPNLAPGGGGRTLTNILIFGAWAYPVLWILPVYLFTYLPNLIRAFVEHSHPENDDKADEHRLITFLSNPIERLFLSPMNMNYHIGHHLWPSIPYYNLPRTDRELRALPKEQLAGLEWRGSYLGYMWRYYVALPLEECRNSRHRKSAGR